MPRRLLVLSLGTTLFLIAPNAFAMFAEDVTPAHTTLTHTRHGVQISSAASSSSSSAVSSAASSTSSVSPWIPKLQSPTEGFKATEWMTRGQFTALVVQKVYKQGSIDHCYWNIASERPPHFTLVYTDVKVGDRFAKEICTAMRDGLIGTYKDGSFRPDRVINMAEASKILARAYALAPNAEIQKMGPWYKPYVQALAVRHAIPLSIKNINQLVTVADAMDMLDRVSGSVTGHPSLTYEELLPKPIRRVTNGTSVSAPSAPRPPVAPVAPAAPATPAPVNPGAASASTTSSKKSMWTPF